MTVYRHIYRQHYNGILLTTGQKLQTDVTVSVHCNYWEIYMVCSPECSSWRLNAHWNYKLSIENINTLVEDRILITGFYEDIEIFHKDCWWVQDYVSNMLFKKRWSVGIHYPKQGCGNRKKVWFVHGQKKVKRNFCAHKFCLTNIKS